VYVTIISRLSRLGILTDMYFFVLFRTVLDDREIYAQEFSSGNMKANDD
jgi:hypothetical protein